MNHKDDHPEDRPKTKRTVIAACGVKLHNRRVTLYKLSDEHGDEFYLHFKKLGDDCKPKVTEILLSEEAMGAVVACYIDIVKDADHTRRPLGINEQGEAP